MAMPRDLPFVVRLRFRKYTQALRNFTLDPRQANIDETSLLEYVPCTLEFAAVSSPPPSDARLYIDGFDALVDADNVLKVDDDRVYLPCGASMHIQGSDAQPGDHFSDDESNYPWIPGNYRVEVQWDGQTYHTVLCVKPKNLNDEQLRLMRVELEEHVVGLTLDIIRKNQGIGRGEFATELPLRFYQYQLLRTFGRSTPLCRISFASRNRKCAAPTTSFRLQKALSETTERIGGLIRRWAMRETTDNKSARSSLPWFPPARFTTTCRKIAGCGEFWKTCWISRTTLR